MQIRKLISKAFRHDADGVKASGGLNAAISANVNEPGSSSTHTRSRQRIVQKSGRTTVSEKREERR